MSHEARLQDLPVLTPDPVRAERMRAKCHAALTRRSLVSRIWKQAANLRQSLREARPDEMAAKARPAPNLAIR